MTKAVGFCVELGRNITLKEAHVEYFKQPPEKRERLRFQCGDPVCRETNQPLIVAALYDRKDAFDERFKSPYFREHAAHPHIESCTWISAADIKRATATGGDSSEIVRSKAIADKLGLVFKISNKNGSIKQINIDGQVDLIKDGDKPIRDNGRGTRAEVDDVMERPETTKFMTTVAMIFLSLNDHERKSIPLEIKGLRKGTFDSICFPIKAFHPFYQKTTIYRGFISIVELTNVFLIKFKSQIAVDGDRTNRTTPAEIKLTKQWLEKNDRTLRTTLIEIIEAHASAQCFFYSVLPAEISKGVARFQILNSDLIGVIPDWAIEHESQETI